VPVIGSVYGYTVYGDNVYGWLRVEYDVEPFRATSYDYGNLTVIWQIPTGQWNAMRLVRSLTGFPVHEDDGEILYEAPREEVDPQVHDEGLEPGVFHYYSLWAYIEITVDDQTFSTWRRAGNAIGIPLKDFGYQEKMLSLLPEFYMDRDRDLTTQREERGPLERTMRMFGEQFDHIRGEYETLLHLRDIDKVSEGLLPLMAHEFDMEIEGELGATYSRRMIQNAVYIYQHKGTKLGMRALVAAATGWDSDPYYDETEGKVIVPLFPDRLNLIPNPSFETVMTGWASDAHTEAQRDETTSRYGGASMRLQRASGGDPGALRAFAPSEMDIPVAIYGWTSYGDESVTYADDTYELEGGFQAAMIPFRPSPVAFWHHYTFSAHIKSEISRTAFLVVSFFDENKEFVTSARSRPFTTSTEEWVRPWVRDLVPRHVHFAAVAVEIQGTEDESHWVDGVLLERADEALPYFDGSFEPLSWYFWDQNTHQSASYFYDRRLPRQNRLAQLIPEHIPMGLDFEIRVGEGALAWGQPDLQGP